MLQEDKFLEMNFYSLGNIQNAFSLKFFESSHKSELTSCPQLRPKYDNSNIGYSIHYCQNNK